jgi:acetyltransferase-like isoleucine patch superfamily enzyme
MSDVKEYFEQARQQMREKWNRVLPSNELVSDRWEKSKFLGFGEGSSVYDSCVVLGNVTVGKDVWVGPFTLLDGSGGLSIGDGCNISAGVQIYSHDTVKRVLSEGKNTIDYSPTVIGNYCHIGAGSIILKGITIGHHSIIGAGCVVTKSFPEYSIIIGTPGKKVGFIKVGEEIEFIYD